MEPEVSLQHLQKNPATCPYPEPAQSTQCPHPKSHFLPAVLFSSISPLACVNQPQGLVGSEDYHVVVTFV